MEKVEFDKTKVLDYFIKSLRNKHLLPKPHLGVLGTKFPESTGGGLFTYSDRPASQNIIGYDFIIKRQGTSPNTTTKFTFYVRSGMIKSSEESDEDPFTQIQLTVSTNLNNLSTQVRIKDLMTNEDYMDERVVSSNNIDSKFFFKTTWEKEFPISYKEFGKDNLIESKNPIKLTLIKNIKQEENGIYRIQLRIINDNENNFLTKIGIKDKELEKYQKIPLGVLLDFDIIEECSQAKFNIKKNRWGTETSIKRSFNLVAQKEFLSRIEFSEYLRGFETIPKFKEGRSKEEFIESALMEGVKIHKEVADSYNHIKSFYKYQEEGIQKIAKELKDKKGIVNIISVRTAGGKTETFAVPIINYCYENLEKKGTKSLIFYPTKALANDQAARIFKSLYLLNKSLKNKNRRPITMGIYHGDIKKTSKEEKELWVPFKCPNPKCNSQITFSKRGIYNKTECLNCGEDLSYLILTRYEIHKEIPDIIVTNQDTLHYTLMNYPENHSIFGRQISYCEECGASHLINKRVCPHCHKSLIKIEPSCSPEVLVLDEIHMLGGAFGMNTSMFLKRLVKTIKSYHKGSEYNPTFIGATATIKHPEEFAKQLFHNSNVNKIPFDESSAYTDETQNLKGDNIQREHLFILPRSYDSADTLSYGMQYILKYFAENLEEKPTILGFCESIKDNRNLIKLTNSRKPKIAGKTFKIEGHTSQFERDLRAETEKKFTKKEIDVLYATSTLEVGVDFDDINILSLHGAPYSFNDYLQRVGRSGRKRDAAVITTLRKWSVLDYFYLEKCKSMLENPKKFIVDPPFNEKNEVILGNHLRAAFFDYMGILPNTDKVFKIKELKEFVSNNSNQMSEEFKSDFKEHCKSCFGSTMENESTLFDSVIKEIEKEIFTNTEIQDCHELFERMNEEHQIGKLRNADKVVEVTFQI